jgi:ABC-2 type transport system permease protein
MKVLDIALKDLLRSLRSMFAVGMMVVAPLMITGLIYAAFGGIGQGQADLPAVRVGLVNQDTPSPDVPVNLGQTMHDMFTDESVKRWLTAADYPDEAAARTAVDRQEIGVAVIIPAGFTASFLADGDAVPIVIVQDPTLSIGPLVVRNMITALLDGVVGGSIALTTIVDRQQDNSIAPDPAEFTSLIQQYQTWYTDFQRAMFHRPDEAALRMVRPAESSEAIDPMGQMLGLIMAGQMIFFAFYTGAYSMMSILREQEEGTLARLFTTPTNRTLILAGKFLAVFLTVIVQGLVLMSAARLAFGVKWGQPGSVALVAVGQVIAASGLGVLLIAFVKTTQQGGPVLGGGLTALGMLGGLFTVGIQNLPTALNTVAMFTPHGWVLRGWRLAMAGQPPTLLLFPCAVTVGMGIVMFALGAALFRRRFA